MLHPSSTLVLQCPAGFLLAYAHSTCFGVFFLCPRSIPHTCAFFFTRLLETNRLLTQQENRELIRRTLFGNSMDPSSLWTNAPRCLRSAFGNKVGACVCCRFAIIST